MAHMIDAIISLKDNFSGVLKQVNANLSHFSRQTGYIGRNVSKVGGAIEGVGSKLTKGVTAPLLGIGLAASKVGMDFEQSMSNVKAVSGASAQDMQMLEKAARDAGASTSKSAKDAADALYYESLAGWNVKTSKEALMPILRLSEAGNLDLARTSDLVTDSYSSLGLSIQNIGKVLPDYLNKVAKASASSNTNIDALMEGMVVAGGTFKNLNVPLQESTALLGVLANRGTKGAEAGNALNSILVNLTTGAGQAGKAMDRIKLNAFDKHTGKFKGVANVLKELREKTKNMTEEQRNLTLAQIGGKTQLDTLQKLLSGVGEEYDNLTSKIKNSDGALNDMAKIMQENNKGSLTALKSALEELGLKIYDELKPKIAWLIGKAKKIVSVLDETSPSLRKSIVHYSIMAIALGPVILMFGKLTVGIGNTFKNISKFTRHVKQAGGVLKFFTSPGMIVVGILLLLAVTAILVAKNWSKIKKAFSDVSKKVSHYTGITKTHVVKFYNSVKKYVKKLSDRVVKSFKSIKTKVSPHLKKLVATFKRCFSQLKPIILPVLAFIVGVFIVKIAYAFSVISTTISTVIDTVSDLISGLIDVFNGVINFLVGIFTGNWSQVWTGIKSIFSGVIEIITSIWDGLVGILSAPVQAVVDILDSLFHDKVAGIKKAWEGVKTFLQHPIQGTISLIKHGNLSGVKTDGSHAVGLTRVPFNGYRAELHEGERVLTKQEAQQYSMGKGGNSITINMGGVTVRNDNDIDAIAMAIVHKLKIHAAIA